MSESVLVACPTARVKDYCLDEYLAAYDAFFYKDKHLLMVNTGNGCSTYHNRLKLKGVEFVKHYPCNEPLVSIQMTVTDVNEDVIIPFAWEISAEWVLHIESDVICPPETISTFLDAAEFYEADLVSASYRARGNTDMYLEQSLGCIMWRRKIFPVGTCFMDYMESYIRQMAYERGHKAVQLTNVLELEHLDG